MAHSTPHAALLLGPPCLIRNRQVACACTSKWVCLCVVSVCVVVIVFRCGGQIVAESHLVEHLSGPQFRLHQPTHANHVMCLVYISVNVCDDRAIYMCCVFLTHRSDQHTFKHTQREERVRVEQQIEEKEREKEKKNVNITYILHNFNFLHLYSSLQMQKKSNRFAPPEMNSQSKPTV